MTYTIEDTIFVQIASYRDPELQHTLQDLFKKAKRPENIFVGICHQYDMKEGTDSHLFEVPFPRPEQLRIDEVDYRDAKGLFFARSKTQFLWRGEKWTVQFDSHMRFESGWDEIAITMLKKLQGKGYAKPIITSSPASYDPDTNKTWEPYLTFLRIGNFVKSEGIIRVMTVMNVQMPEGPTFTAFISGNFFFTVGEHAKEIPYDTHMYFTDEENVAVRSWTNGYDLFNADKSICYHLWNTEAITKTKAKRPILSDDNKIGYHSDSKSNARERHLFKMELSNNKGVLDEIEKYSVGKVRSLHDYERFSGIDFRKRKNKEFTEKGIFKKWQKVNGIPNIKNLFLQNLPHYRPKLETVKEPKPTMNTLCTINNHRFEIFYPKNDKDYFSYLCDLYGSDKGELTSSNNPYPWPSHTYADFYGMLFDHCRYNIKNVLECGLGTNNPNLESSMGVNGKPGASLRVWRDYFPNANVVGIDIDGDILFEEERIKTFQVDQTSPQSIQNFLEVIQTSDFDLIVDDGLHKYHAGICLFENSIGHLRSGGVYIIEDINPADLLQYISYFESVQDRYLCRFVKLHRPNLEVGDNIVLMITKKEFKEDYGLSS
jgi:SAM-dependent methyltransferase